MKITHFFRLTAALTLLAVSFLTQAADTPASKATAIFAGGCFWCVEADFEKLPGVIEAESGYTAGQTKNPSYEAVSAGHTGHAEAVRVIYDPQKVSYAQLVDYFWHHIDPTVKDRQFCDIGNQYRSGIYWQNEAERKVAEESRDALLKSGRFPVIYTEVLPATPSGRPRSTTRTITRKTRSATPIIVTAAAGMRGYSKFGARKNE